jgi:hypothetical protein
MTNIHGLPSALFETSTVLRVEPEPAQSVVRLIDQKRPEAAAAPPWRGIDGALLEERSTAVPAFPLDLLPSPWRSWIADTARSLNVPADYVAQAVLAAVAGICGAGVMVRVSSVWVEPLWLWLAVVGAPSSGKSPALAAVRRLLSDLEKEDVAVDGIEPGAPDPGRRSQRIVGDSSLGAVLEVMRENWRSAILWRDEPAGCFAPLVAGGGVRAVEPYLVSILGVLEPDRLAATVQRGEESLAARFLYTWPAAPAYQPLAERTPARDDEALALLRAIRGRAGTLGQGLRLCLEEAGVAALDGFLAGLHDDQRRAEGLQAAWLGKGRGLVPRLAGVLHLLEGSAARAADPAAAVGEIGRDTVERAIALWSGYFRPHAKAFFDHAAPSDLEARARRVVRWLQTCGAEEVSREDVRRTALGQTVNASEADRVLARLTEGGILRPIAPERPSPRGGRPALRWQVTPVSAEKGVRHRGK